MIRHHGARWHAGAHHEKLNKASVAIVTDPDLTPRIKSMGGIEVGNTPEEVTQPTRLATS